MPQLAHKRFPTSPYLNQSTLPAIVTGQDVTIDPNGDTVLVLKNPIYLFDTLKAPALPENDSTKALGFEDVFGKDPFDFEGDTSQGNADSRSNDQSDGEDETDEPEIRFVVSSRQLRIVSPYFESVFSHTFAESSLQDDGKYHVEAEDFHPDALAHVLNIVHVQNQKVPPAMSLEMLAHICVIADYYDIRYAFAPWVDLWLSKLKKQFDLNHDCVYSRDHVLALFVANVFAYDDEFRTIARSVICSSPAFGQHLGLPQMDTILQNLFEHRLNSARLLDSKLKDIEQEYQDGETGCGQEPCRSEITTYIQSQRDRAKVLQQKEGRRFMSVMKDMKRANFRFQIMSSKTCLNCRYSKRLAFESIIEEARCALGWFSLEKVGFNLDFL